MNHDKKYASHSTCFMFCKAIKHTQVLAMTGKLQSIVLMLPSAPEIQFSALVVTANKNLLDLLIIDLSYRLMQFLT